VAGEYGTCLRSLETRETAELLGLDRHLLPETDFVGGTAKEGDTVGIERFVNGSGARLGTSDRDAASRLTGLLAEGSLVALAQILDDGSLHSELDQIHRQEPDNVL
jgi:hypothetical protein